MLHTQFRGNRQGGSGKEDFELFSSYIGMAAILGHVTSIISTIFLFACTLKLTYKIWFKTAKWFLRKACINFHIAMKLGQGQEMPLTFNTHIPS